MRPGASTATARLRPRAWAVLFGLLVVAWVVLLRWQPRDAEAVAGDPVPVPGSAADAPALLEAAAEREALQVEAPRPRAADFAPFAPSVFSARPAPPEAPSGTFWLHVVEAGTGRPLRDLTLVTPRGWIPTEARQPGSALDRQILRSGASSPLELTGSDARQRRRESTYFVRAPGHAWGRFDLEPTRTGEATLTLHPGGDVVIRRSGSVPKPHAWLRVRRLDAPGEPLWCEERLEDRERVELDGLLPGPYRASVEVGPVHEGPEVLGSVEFLAQADTVREVVLAIDLIPALLAVPLAGCVTLPAAYGLDSFELTIRAHQTDDGSETAPIVIGKAAMAVDPVLEDTWRWYAGLLVSGRYSACLEPLGHRVEFRLGPEGLEDLCIRQSPPVRVRVRVTDRDTGVPRAVERIHWTQSAGRGSGIARPSAGLSASTFEFDVPSDLVNFWVGDPTWGGPAREARFMEGPAEVTLTVGAMCVVHVLLMDGTTEVSPRSFGYMQAVGHEGTSLSVSFPARDDPLVRRRIEVRTDRPGLYRFDLPAPPGYAAIPTQEIQVEAGRINAVLIQLEALP